MCTMFKIFNFNNSPDIFKELFLTNSEVHSYNTRGASKLHLGYTRLELGKKCISYAGAHFWNELKFDKDCSLITFKNRLLDYVLTNCDRL